MPKSNAVWGIDIGNAALKALRVRPGEAPDEIVVLLGGIDSHRIVSHFGNSDN